MGNGGLSTRTMIVVVVITAAAAAPLCCLDLLRLLLPLSSISFLFAFLFYLHSICIPFLRIAGDDCIFPCPPSTSVSLMRSCLKTDGVPTSGRHEERTATSTGASVSSLNTRH